MTSQKVVLVAGGTGGHVMPAWASAQMLASQGIDCVFITDPRGATFLPAQDLLPQELLPALAPLNRLSTLVSWTWGLGKQLIRSLALLKKHRPTLVVGFGGYPCLALGLAARLQGIPLWIHEQNAVLGRTNRLLSLWAERVLVTFPITHKVRDPQRVTLMGLPLRPQVIETILKAPPSPDYTSSFTLLILGGSQGAEVFGTLIPQALQYLSAPQRARVRLVQQCRAHQVEPLEATYRSLGITHQVAPFFQDTPSLMAQADALIGRSGASTLNEWLAFKKPALFIPYPAAKDDHQKANADWVVNHGPQGLFQSLTESALTPEGLGQILQRWMDSRATELYQGPSPLPSAQETQAVWLSLIKASSGMGKCS